MTDRRSFIAAAAALGGELLLGRARPGTAGLRVEATPTVFYAPPDGRNALVRFRAAGVTAPGGRLRIFDPTRRQLGTAGMIGIGGTLYGELWLPLDREAEFSSELELPGVRGVVRGTHRVRARRRWTLHWVTVVDPGAIADDLARSDPLVASATARALRETGVGVNPLPEVAAPEALDHGPFLRMLSPAADLEARYGAPPSLIALDTYGQLLRVASAPLLLTGSGTRWVAVRREPGAESIFRQHAADGSSVTVISLADGGEPADLGFASGGDQMARRLERWLESLGPLAGDERTGAALVLGTDARQAWSAAARLSEWNARFAYPRIVSGGLPELLSLLERQPPAAPPGNGPRPGRTVPPPGGYRDIARHREGRQRRRVELAVAPLVARLASSAAGLAAVAEQFAFRVPATLVFNATPFARTDLAVMPDGTERIVTDVPAMGYACVPYPGYGDEGRRWMSEGEAGRWSEIPGGENEVTLEGQSVAARLDSETGAIRSLLSRADGRDWAQPRGAGLNAAPGFRLGGLRKFRNPGVGTRIVAQRASPAGATLRSAVTVYDRLPWLDIANELEANGTELEALGFGFALDYATVAWEIPAGFLQDAAPVEGLVHLRWLTLSAGGDVIFFRGLDAPAAAVAADGTILSLEPPRRSRYRLGFASGFTAPEDPWRFGWGTEPFATAPVPGTGRATLPSFGSLVVVDQPGVAMLEIRTARDGNGIVLYLQELLGAARDITLGPGLLVFRGGRRVDFLERDLARLPTLTGGGGGGGVAVPVRAYGVTAVRLTDVELARG